MKELISSSCCSIWTLKRYVTHFCVFYIYTHTKYMNIYIYNFELTLSLYSTLLFLYNRARCSSIPACSLFMTWLQILGCPVITPTMTVPLLDPTKCACHLFWIYRMKGKIVVVVVVVAMYVVILYYTMYLPAVAGACHNPQPCLQWAALWRPAWCPQWSGSLSDGRSPFLCR